MECISGLEFMTPIRNKTHNKQKGDKMGNKEKDSEPIIKTASPVVRELNEEALKVQLQERLDYHNEIAKKREQMIAEVNRLTEAQTHARGEISNIQNLITEYYPQDAPSVNGEA